MFDVEGHALLDCARKAELLPRWALHPRAGQGGVECAIGCLVVSCALHVFAVSTAKPSGPSSPVVISMQEKRAMAARCKPRGPAPRPLFASAKTDAKAPSRVARQLERVRVFWASVHKSAVSRARRAHAQSHDTTRKTCQRREDRTREGACRGNGGGDGTGCVA